MTDLSHPLFESAILQLQHRKGRSLKPHNLQNLTISPPKDQSGNYPIGITLKTFDEGAEGAIRKNTSVVVVPGNRAPTAIEVQSKGLIPENAAEGTEVLSVANIRDPNVGDTHSYVLTNGSDLFSIHPKTGIVSVKEKLEYEKASTHSLTIEAIDNGVPPLSFAKSFEIKVKKVDE